MMSGIASHETSFRHGTMPASGAVRQVNRPYFLALRWIVRLGLKVPLQLVRGFRVTGAARLPQRRQPLILACNHAAFIDSIYLILAARCRFTICGAKPRLFRNAGFRFAMALANILKVESREQFLGDTSALLAAGETVLIYPEMGRFPEALGDFRTWAAETAIRNRVSILPCYLYGTTRGHDRSPHLYVGEPIEALGDPESLTQRLREAILALAPPVGGVGREA